MRKDVQGARLYGSLQEIDCDTETSLYDGRIGVCFSVDQAPAVLRWVRSQYGRRRIEYAVSKLPSWLLDAGREAGVRVEVTRHQ